MKINVLHEIGKDYCVGTELVDKADGRIWIIIHVSVELFDLTSKDFSVDTDVYFSLFDPSRPLNNINHLREDVTLGWIKKYMRKLQEGKEC